MSDPVIQIIFSLQDGADDVDNTEMNAYTKINVSRISVFREYKAGFSSNQEVN